MTATVSRASTNASDRCRLRVTVSGAVQGVGFRPFVYRLATTLGLSGWIANDASGVAIEIEGPKGRVQRFLQQLRTDKPGLADIAGLEASDLPAAGGVRFEIRHSAHDGARSAWVLPDIATCRACRRELLDPGNRRYRYPFTNCTDCGPRFSIIQRLPYDRAQTTMARFEMCPQCRAEYLDPADRRFHAQPNACPVCGPRLQVWTPDGQVVAEGHAAIEQAAAAIRRGAIVAVKGLGGFQLCVDAGNAAAVQRLRQRKCREAKPLALMFPTATSIRGACRVDAVEQALLISPQAPIVLLRRRLRPRWRPVTAVAEGAPGIGAMLPHTPLHHLLMHELRIPVVATSGNRSDEPMCIDEVEALDRLAEIADVYLVHDRPIERHVDDSVVQVMAGREVILRRARGYAPLPLTVATTLEPTLAVGAQQKNSVAVAAGRHIFISQHIGDLDTPQACAAFSAATSSLTRLYGVRPRITACDLHPDYHATRMAREWSTHPVPVQHHHAHVVSCMAEHDLAGPVLGVAWDGTGWGPDHTVWGGEFLLCDRHGYQRVAHLRHFRLPGGGKAIEQPRRCAVGVLYELFGAEFKALAPQPVVRSFSSAELSVIREALQRRLNCPQTSSMGRLFDAVAALIGLRQIAAFEGQAAMDLEAACGALSPEDSYPFRVDPAQAGGPLVIDWEPLIRRLLDEVHERRPAARMAAAFHSTLVHLMLAVARKIGNRRVVLSGGCFQNRLLVEHAVARLRSAGFEPFWHRRIPPNDGGIAVGQVLVAAGGSKRDA